MLSEEPEQTQRTSKYLEQTPFYLFPIGGCDHADLLAQLDHLQTNISSPHPALATVATQTFTAYRSDANYAVSIVGRNSTEITKEIDNAVKGITKAFETGEDWLTPLGSYFTAKPLGQNGEVAYIYPAAVNSYIGIGRNLFRLFPRVHEDTAIKSLYSVVADISRLVFPRSLNKLTTRQLENLEKQLLDDSLAIFETDMGFARLVTTIIRDDFQVKPKYAFGYSLGETSMMASTGVWSNFSQGINAFHTSPLFGDRISGAKNAVREYWGMPTVGDAEDDSFWSTYLLMADPKQVQESLSSEPRVYLTQINTPEEVVIAGDSEACQRVIKALGCNAFRAPFNHAIHNEAMRSEYWEIVKVNTLPATEIPGVNFYSSAEYRPIPLNSDAIAHSIAKCLSEPLDFPKLANQVYNDGARIFLETGSGNICSRWIDKTLENKPHTTISLNRRGTDDHTTIVRALAKLLSHRVPLNLIPLYSQEKPTAKKATIKTVTVGGHNIIDSILTPENRKLFQGLLTQLPLQTTSQKPIQDGSSNSNIEAKIKPMQEEIAMKKVINNSSPSSETLKFEKSSGIPEKTPELISKSSVTIQNIEFQTRLANISTLHFEQVTSNYSCINQSHAAFLKSRQEFSKQISEIIQLQIACVENLLSK